MQSYHLYVPSFLNLISPFLKETYKESDPVPKESECVICEQDYSLSEFNEPCLITKCGHIFCSPCILHYLCTGDKSWSRCPLCFDAIYKKTLKSEIIMEKIFIQL